MLCEVVIQLVEKNDQLAGPLLLLYDDHSERKTHPLLEESFSLLKNTLSLVDGAAYLVVDALDEISREKRRKFMDLLLRLRTETPSLRLMITSRPLPDVVAKFDNSPTLEIQASRGDVDQFVTGQFQNFRAPMNDDYREKVRQCIAKTANGL